MEDRLQKILAHAGVASRRKCEEMIISGRVTVDGIVVQELGAKADPSRQTIAVDGKPVAAEAKMCLILHKPTSYVSTVSDPEGRRTVMTLLDPVEQRLYPVGRLDYESSGLLVMTNDGDLTNKLLHPSTHVDKVYRVTVLGMPDKSAISQLQTGIRLEEGMTSPAQVTVLRHHPQESVLEITIHEGKNRQVRRMFEHIEHPVKRLKRIQFGPLHLGPLPSGQWRWLTAEEWNALYSAVGLTPPAYPFQTEKRRVDRGPASRRNANMRKMGSKPTRQRQGKRSQ